MATAKKTRSRYWTPGCEAAPAIGPTKLVNHDGPVQLRARKPKKAKSSPKRKKKKKTREATGEGLKWSHQEMMVFLVRLAPLLEMGEDVQRQFAPSRVSKSGPKRKYSDIEPLVIAAARTMLEMSWRNTVNFLSDPELWSRMAQALETAYPNHPNRRLYSEPLTWNQFQHYRRGHWDEDTLEKLKDSLTEASLEALNYMGGFSTDTKVGNQTHPHKTQTATGDGSWFRARHQATPQERDEAAALGITILCNDDSRHYHDEELSGDCRGYHEVMNTWHSGHRQERLLLSFDFADAGETDATVSVRMAREMKAKYPHLTKGFLGMEYDMRASAPNADDLLDAGILPITKVSETAKGKSSANLGEHVFTLTSGTKEHPHQERRRVMACDGNPVIEIVDAQGIIHYEPLVRTKTYARKYPHRTTFYNDYVVRDRPIVPPHLVGATVSIRLNSTPEERNAKPRHRRRTLALRPISEFDEDFDRLYGGRQDSESNFSDVKRILLHYGRVPAETKRALTVCFLSYGFKLLVTSLFAYHQRTGASLKGWFGDHPPPYRGKPTY